MAPAKKTAIVANLPIQPVSELQTEQEVCAIVVRVLRKWDVMLPRSGVTPVAVDLLLVDREGTKIVGHIDQPYMYVHAQLLNEGAVYNISRFGVVMYNGEYRAAHHDYRINIKFKTEIKRVDDAEVPIPPYEFTPPEECFNKEFNRSFLVDVAGVLTGFGQETTFKSPITSTGTSTRLKIDLENRGFRYSVTLFGELTTELKTFIATGGGQGAVVAILFCKVNTWPGGTSIQTTMKTSKLLFNPDIPETNLLRETVSQTLTTTPLTITRSTRWSSDQEGFLDMDQKFTLSDIREMLEVNEFVSTAIITSCLDDKPWWYWSCKVDNRSCKEEDDVAGLYYCPGCNKHITNVVRKYLLKLLLVDDTDTIIVVLFDNTARKLTGQTAECVYQSWQEDPNREKLPPEVLALKGQEAIFRIQAEQKEGSTFPRSYRVRNVSSDKEIIKSYKDKWNSEDTIEGAKEQVLMIEDTPSESVVSVQNSAGCVTQDLMVKFNHSASDSTNVVESNNMVDITRDTDETPPIKRKAPTDAASSTSKLPLKSIKVEK